MLHNVYRTLVREAPILYLYIQIILFSIFRILVSYTEKTYYICRAFSNGLKWLIRLYKNWFVYTVWPEILAGRYFGGLLKICHLAEFTLAVESVLDIIIFIAKWLIERAGNFTGL